MAAEFPEKLSTPHVIAGVGGIQSAEAFGIPTIWRLANFAEYWFHDACAEAVEAGNTQRRRREITFAVAAVESYLLEWVRDEVLKRDFLRLDEYFPPNERRPITDKWKLVPRKLVNDGLLAAAPNCSGDTWRDFRILLDYRNGLMHARASRPESHGLTDEQLPMPSMLQLQKLEPGWAVGVCERMICELHSAAGTPKPAWMKRERLEI